MNRFYCPICGKELVEEFAIGDICSCCGNESCVSDDILSDELIKFSNKDFACAGYNRRELEEYSVMPIKIAHKLLRANWINNGCIWKYNDLNEMPCNWSMDKAKEQLINIDEKWIAIKKSNIDKSR